MRRPAQASDLILSLSLQPHPEGGFYRETYRSALRLATPGEGFSGPRAAATAIYYLLQRGDFSAFHRIRSDEMWHFYEGDPLVIHVLGAGSAGGAPVYHSMRVGDGECYQAVVPAGAWFAAEPEGDFSLVGCTVAPGFDFEDFEMARRQALLAEFPGQAQLVRRLTRLE